MWIFPITSNCGRRVLSSARTGERGATLAELLVVLTILSILAAVAVPFAQTSVQRRDEVALKQTLREVRTAIDRFHEDWRSGRLSEDTEGVSAAGFPTSFDVLIEGLSDEDGNPLRYLRRLPDNPFAGREAAFEDQWLLLGYGDPPDATTWSEEDIYDLRARTERLALDGTNINEW